MEAAEQGADPVADRHEIVGLVDADRDGADRAAEGVALQLAQRGRQRHDDDVVAVDPAEALAADAP